MGPVYVKYPVLFVANKARNSQVDAPMTSTIGHLRNSERYSRGALEKWRKGADWQTLASKWLEELVQTHGKEKFRTRKGSAKEHVKELCEEVLPLAVWMANDPHALAWEAKFSPRGILVAGLAEPGQALEPVHLWIL
jgi:hypothetical protein